MPTDRQLLIPFWIKIPNGMPQYLGVSAYSPEDAFHLLAEAGYNVRKDQAEIIENVKPE